MGEMMNPIHSHLRGNALTGPLVRLALVLAILTSLFGGLVVTPVARAEGAQINSCGLTVEIVAAPYAVVDSNKPGIEGPRAAMLGARIRNTSGIVVPDASVTFSSPTLTPLSGSQTTYFLNDLAAGASISAYWPVNYPATFNVNYPYAITVTAPNGCSATATSTLQTQSQLSATSNKVLPTGATRTVTPEVVRPGSLVTVRITGFTLGQVGAGPKGLYDAWLQPIGNLDFDPSCLRLVRTEVRMASVSATPFIDQLYFTNLRSYTANPADYVAYTFIATRVCSTGIQPYQEAASGNLQKYNSDFSTSRIGISSGGSSTLVINVQPSTTTVNPLDTVRYTISYSAPDGPVGYPQNGSPVIINANIPAQTTYVAGSATETAAADAEFSTDGSTWTTTEPTDPAAVGDIRWILANPVDATVQSVQYDVAVRESYNGAPLLVSVGASVLGSSTLSADSATVTKGTSNSAPNALDDTAQTAANTSVTTDVAANDSDADGNLDPNSATIVAQPTNGMVTPAGPGMFTYTPNQDFVGHDTFTYRICDTAAACSEATVVVAVGFEGLQWQSNTISVAYEDLKNYGWSDWDYNDFIVKIDSRTGVDALGQVNAFEIEYEALARGAGFNHRFIQNLPIEGGGVAAVSVYLSDGTLVAQSTTPFGANTNFTIFDRTLLALPRPEVASDRTLFATNTMPEQQTPVLGRKAKLVVYLNQPAANPAISLPPAPWDPYLYVYFTREEVHLLVPGHLNNTQVVNPLRDPNSPLVGYDLPLAQTIAPTWRWPLEQRGIWNAYPQFVPYVGSGGATNGDWWQPANAVDSFLWKPGAVAAAELDAADKSAAVVSRYFAGPVLADINANGWNEIILGNLLANRVEVYDALRRPLAGWPQEVDGGVKAAPAVADLDGDGRPEIIAGTSAGSLYAWHASGQMVAGFPVSLHAGYRILATPAVVDLDGDGGRDIVVPATDGKLYAFDRNGAPRPGWPVAIGVADQFGGQVINSSPRIADIDGDGVLEIIVGSTDKRVYAINRDGSVRWSYPTGDMVLSTPAVADIAPNVPGLETVVGSGDRYLYLLDANGNALWRRATAWTVRSSPVVADLDGAPGLEIVIGSDDDRVWAWHANGDVVSGWPQSTGADVLSSVQVADINGDGNLEVIVGSDDAKVWAWHANGTPVAGWPRQTALSVKGAPALGNLDNDALPEILAADLSGTLYVWNVDDVTFPAAHLPLILNAR
jgi:LruC domain-containing protein